MAQHLQKGHHDRRRTSQAEMQAAGVPLDKRPVSQFTRADSKWAMEQWHAWRSENRDASREDCALQLRHFYNQWREVGAEEQARNGPDNGGQIGEDNREQSMHATECEGDPWDVGDAAWPVSEATLSSFLEEFAGTQCDGVARKMEGIRWDFRHKLLHQDTGSVPSEAKLHHRMCCREAHPGL